MWGDGPEAFHGVPCETGELWVTWRLGTQGPKGQGGIEAQEERGMAWGYQQSATRPVNTTALIERTDICFDSSFVSRFQGFLLVCLSLQPFLRQPV